MASRTSEPFLKKKKKKKGEGPLQAGQWHRFHQPGGTTVPVRAAQTLQLKQVLPACGGRNELHHLFSLSLSG